MGFSHDIICIGAAYWDVIGRSATPMRPGDDCPGIIRRTPGGVALNIATALAGNGLRTALLSVVGHDAEGDSLLAALDVHGVETSHICRCDDVATDCYLAIEGSSGLVAAVADTTALDWAGDSILTPLRSAPPYRGWIVLDGNLSAEVIATIAHDPAFSVADLRVALATPAKAARVMPLLPGARATFYLNRAEAAALCQRNFTDSSEAARGLVNAGAVRAIVTDGAAEASDADATCVISALPPTVMATRVTGAGDAFMAAHIVAETRGHSRAKALAHAIDAAAAHIACLEPTTTRTA